MAHITAGLVVEASEKESGQHNNITGVSVLLVILHTPDCWVIIIIITYLSDIPSNYLINLYIVLPILFTYLFFIYKFIHSISQPGGSIPVQSFPGFSHHFPPALCPGAERGWGGQSDLEFSTTCSSFPQLTTSADRHRTSHHFFFAFF